MKPVPPEKGEGEEEAADAQAAEGQARRQSIGDAVIDHRTLDVCLQHAPLFH